MSPAPVDAICFKDRGPLLARHADVQGHEVAVFDAFGQEVGEGHLFAGVREVVQLEVDTPAVELERHAHQRGHADTAGNEHVLVGVGGDAEQVAGLADLEVVADLQLVDRG
jgi:hypothetical protein